MIGKIVATTFLIHVLFVSCAVKPNDKIFKDVDEVYYLDNPQHSTSLILFSDSTYSYIRQIHQPVPGVENVNKVGTYSRDASSLTLTEQDSENDKINKYWMVVWGDYKLMIKDDQITFFANEFRDGDLWSPGLLGASANISERYLINYMKPGPVSPKTHPIFPSQFDSLFHEKFLHCKIVEIDTSESTIVINVGKSDGAFVGLHLYHEENDKTDEYLIIQVQDSTSVAQNVIVGVFKLFDEMKENGILSNKHTLNLEKDLKQFKKEFKALKIGTKLTSRKSDHPHNNGLERTHPKGVQNENDVEGYN